MFARSLPEGVRPALAVFLSLAIAWGCARSPQVRPGASGDGATETAAPVQADSPADSPAAASAQSEAVAQPGSETQAATVDEEDGGAPAEAVSGVDTATRMRALRAIPAGLPVNARFLRGVRVALDPGHGGDVGEPWESQGYKRGPTGLRESVINLRTAEFLAGWLRESGAEVLLTRTDDSTVSLEDRNRLPLEWNADIFISIHHNASPRPTTNFSSVWYHADGEAHPASLDLARELCDGLVRELQLPGAAASGIYSDKLMYENGFAVLRNAGMPAVLAECSFFTNPEEETLLRDEAYNRRVAWGLFTGLADWAAMGVPRWEPDLLLERELVVSLRDGMKESWGADVARIRPHSVRASLDGRAVARPFVSGGRLRLQLPESATDETVIRVDFENRAKNASVTRSMTLGDVRRLLTARETAAR